MIQAFKNSTLTAIQQNIFKIREKELSYWINTFRTMTTESALLTGFCFGGLVLDVQANQWLYFGYLAATTFSMGFGLLCITIATFCLMFGQGRALRGEGLDSMDIAIEQLKEKSFSCFRFFMLELFFFHISAFLLMWIYYRFIVALVLNIILGAFLILFVRNGYDIISQLHVDEKDAVTGKFISFANNIIGGDLDKRQQEKPQPYQEFQDEPKPYREGLNFAAAEMY